MVNVCLECGVVVGLWMCVVGSLDGIRFGHIWCTYLGIKGRVVLPQDRKDHATHTALLSVVAYSFVANMSP